MSITIEREPHRKTTIPFHGMSRKAGVFWILLMLSSVLSFGLDHRNLDENLPLTVEDAYPIKFREIVLQTMGWYRSLEDDTAQAEWLVEVEYGLARNMQLSVSAEFLNRTPGENEGSGNIDVDVLYNWNTETLTVPAFAVKAGIGFPSGIGEEGTDLSVLGIMTKSFRFHRIHINAGYTFVTDSEGEQRDGRWSAVIGWDHPAGLHSMILADLVVKQSESRLHETITLLEFGLRRQLTPRWVFHAGGGAGLTGGPERSRFHLGAGISRSF